MVGGTYNAILKTPMGAKKAELVLKEEEGVLSGGILVKGEMNPISSGTVNGDTFSFDGELKTSVGKLAYECEGSVSGNTLNATAKAKKGTIQITGTRK